VTQVALAVSIAAMAMMSPREQTWLLGALALATAFISASQDIVFDAYRTDIARPEERGLAGALTVAGYRIGMLASGALALVLVAGSGWIPGIGWRGSYLFMAGLMGVGVLATLAAREPDAVPAAPRTLLDAYAEPLREFFSRPAAVGLLVLLVLYKLGDAFAFSLSTAFLLRGAGFTLNDVAAVNKTMAIVATIAGALLGGALMVRLRLFTALMAFGILQAVATLSFVALALSGKSYPLMVIAVGLENFTSGMGTAAFVALLMALCDHRFTAAQYALLSALSAVGRVYVGPLAGYATDPRHLGMSWPSFFFTTFLLALPGLALLAWMRPAIEALDSRQEK
jgi:PAT family beta-lactamase induction signal transducer AmpG